MGRVADPQSQPQYGEAGPFKLGGREQTAHHRRADYTTSIIIPVFNGQAQVDATLRAVTGHFAGRRPFEVIVVDDGSRDRTAALVEAWVRHTPEVRLVRLSANQGKGAAVRAGMREASGDHRCFFDADLPMPVTALNAVLARLDAGADVAIASRTVHGSQVIDPPGPLRRMLSGAFSRVVRALFTLPYQDTQCGLKGFSRRAAQGLFAASRLDGFAFDVELLLLARQLGYAVEEVPVRVDNQAPSTVRIIGHAPRIALDLWRLARIFRGTQPREVLQPGRRERLTVAVLTKNEEPRIARCLASVRWADELIVVDGLSTDRTVEICRQYGARVISHAFEGSFAAERNLGLQHATGEWVLHLDADDIVTPEFRSRIEHMLAAPQPHAALKFRRKSFLLGRFMRHGGWHHYLPNLVRRDAVRYEGLVHERPRVQGTVGILDADVEHHPCEDLKTFLDRHNRYTSLYAEELAKTDGRLEEPEIRRRLLRKPWKAFWKTYVKKQGFREGMHGLVFSLFFAGVEMIKWAKYWEWSRSPEPTPAPAKPSPPAAHRRRTETLSVGLMTKNEESRLAECLDHIVGWADEIVVIDDDSTDRTVEIARRYTDRVFVHPSQDNHDAQWNYGIERSTSEWILHIDADEVVTPQLKAAIDAALSDASGVSAFEMMRKNMFLGHPMRYGGWHHRHLVLFRRLRARCTGQGIHVQLAVDGPIKPLEAELEHYPFSSLSQFLARQNHYTSIEARGMVQRSGRPALREIIYQLTWRPIKLFRKSYRKQQGHREGMYGLVFALLYAFMHIVYWAKVWERAYINDSEGKSFDFP